METEVDVPVCTGCTTEHLSGRPAVTWRTPLRKIDVDRATDRRSFVAYTGADLVQQSPSKRPRLQTSQQKTSFAGTSSDPLPNGVVVLLPDCCPRCSEPSLERQRLCRFAGAFRGGSDGTRTRDLRRDRPARRNRLRPAPTRQGLCSTCVVGKLSHKATVGRAGTQEPLRDGRSGGM